MFGNEASTFVDQVDFAFWFIFGISAFFLAGITIFMAYCCVRFSRKNNPKATCHVEGSVLLEVIWTVIPLILVLFMFWFGWEGYVNMRTVPDNAMEIKTNAGKWYWKFTYPLNEALAKEALAELSKEKGETYALKDVPPMEQDNTQGMTIPIDQPIYVPLHSDDVVHSFFVPAFRVKFDVMPKVKGEENWMWFESTKVGSYNLLCAEYCGVDHARMITKVHVKSREDYNVWYKKAFKVWANGVLNSPGRALYKSNGCFACHKLDDTAMLAPSFKGLFGKTEIVTTKGQEREITVDEAYLVKSIKDPAADVVKPFAAIMPKNTLTEEQVKQLVEFIKQQK